MHRFCLTAWLGPSICNVAAEPANLITPVPAVAPEASSSLPAEIVLLPA
jgi:hypothetical protein